MYIILEKAFLHFFPDLMAVIFNFLEKSLNHDQTSHY